MSQLLHRLSGSLPRVFPDEKNTSLFDPLPGFRMLSGIQIEIEVQTTTAMKLVRNRFLLPSTDLTNHPFSCWIHKEDMGGSITVASIPGKGTFTFRLPLETADPGPSKPAAGVPIKPEPIAHKKSAGITSQTRFTTLTKPYMRFLLACIFTTVLVACATPLSKHKILVGRWRSDTAPTGYWIIDRYSDGRFAAKEFLSYDYKMPTEILLRWGTWRLLGKTYEQKIVGTTSPFVSKFIGRTAVYHIQAISEDRFAWKNNEGCMRIENRIPAADPLPAFVMKLTKCNPSDPNYFVKTTPLESAPAWCNALPK
jgi:hypothetical protein